MRERLQDSSESADDWRGDNLQQPKQKRWEDSERSSLDQEVSLPADSLSDTRQHSSAITAEDSQGGPSLPALLYSWEGGNWAGRGAGWGAGRGAGRPGLAPDLGLQLRLVWEAGVELPDKLQLELWDGAGRLAWQRRQNVYSGVVQERVGLGQTSGSQDYRLVVTSLTGSLTNTITIPLIFQQESNTNPPFSSPPQPGAPSPLPPPSVLSHHTLPNREPQPQVSPERKEESAEQEELSVTGSPLPDLEEVPRTAGRKASWQVVRQLPGVRYKWHHGFRPDPAGRYCKSSLLTVRVEYSPADPAPAWLELAAGPGPPSRLQLRDKTVSAEFPLKPDPSLVVVVQAEHKLLSPAFSLAPSLGPGQWGTWCQAHLNHVDQKDEFMK